MYTLSIHLANMVHHLSNKGYPSPCTMHNADIVCSPPSPLQQVGSMVPPPVLLLQVEGMDPPPFLPLAGGEHGVPLPAPSCRW